MKNIYSIRVKNIVHIDPQTSILEIPPNIISYHFPSDDILTN